KLDLIDAVIAKWESRNYVQLNPEHLLWKPLIYGPSGGINSAPALTLIPQAGSSAPMVSNSISMITEFLKDDIDNPYTFEEEAYKSIEASLAEKSSGSENRNFEADDYHLCHPDIEIATQEKPSLETDDVKLAAPNSEDMESESGSSDTESEEFVEDNGKPLTADRSIGALISENDLVSGEEADELFEEDSEPDKGEASLEDDDDEV
ncbi:hypothetical protein OXX80_014039, partial [Metschnikowia pulcherrima]